MELPTTAGKEAVGVTRAVKDEKRNSIAVVLDQEIDALQINYATVASDVEMDKAPIEEFWSGQRLTEMLFLLMCLKKKLLLMIYTKPLKIRGTCCGLRVH